MLRSDLCDCNKAYIVVNWRIHVTGASNANRRSTKLSVENSFLFRSCISKINDTFVGNVEFLNFVMPIYNLLEYRNNYSITSESLWNHYRDEVSNSTNGKDNGQSIVFYWSW